MTVNFIDGAIYDRLHRLLSGLSSVNSERGYDLDDFIAADVHLTQALLYAPAFCPPLIEIDGLVFQWLVWTGRRDEATALVRRLLAKYGTPRAVQEKLNFVDITRIFRPEQPTLAVEADSVLASLLAVSWAGCLCAISRADLRSQDPGTRRDGRGGSRHRVL